MDSTIAGFIAPIGTIEDRVMDDERWDDGLTFVADPPAVRA